MIHPVVQSPPGLAEEIAAAWLLRRDRGEEVEHDPRFIAWRGETPDNARAWTHAVTLWRVAGAPPREDPLFAALRRDALQARPDRHPVIAAAAAVAAVAVIGIGLTWSQWASRLTLPPAHPGALASAAPTFAVAEGPPDTFALPDGSRATLNANSAIAVDYRAGGRAVRLLRGQAYFSVVHDPSRPFTVAARTRTITDLGTEFDVRLSGEAMTVTLAKGAVAVSSPSRREAVRLSTPGQQLIATPAAGDRVAHVDLTEALSWRARMLDFADTPLARAVAEVNRFGGPPARVVGPAAASLRVSGQYRAGDPARFARSLAQAYPLRVRMRDDGGADIATR